LAVDGTCPEADTEETGVMRHAEGADAEVLLFGEKFRRRSAGVRIKAVFSGSRLFREPVAGEGEHAGRRRSRPLHGRSLRTTENHGWVRVRIFLPMVSAGRVDEIVGGDVVAIGRS